MTERTPPRGANDGRAIVIALVAVLCLTFTLVAVLGARQAARHERVLGVLTPAIESMTEHGRVAWEWCLLNGRDIARATTGAAAVLALIGLVSAWRTGLAFLLIAAGAALATWGEVFLLNDAPALGTGLYAAAVVCAIGFGWLWPMTRLAGFPVLPAPKRRGEIEAEGPEPGRRASRIPLGWECVIVFGLTCVGLALRTYALTELPRHFDGEMIEGILASRSLYGLGWYLQFGFLSNTTGLPHLLPRSLLFELFGTSIYTVRLSALLFGVMAIPLLYWLTRRIAGVGAAIAATVFFIVAPEQLFWARNENAHFAPVAVCAIVTAHIGLWMVDRLSIGAVLTAALWTPFCRYFYAPCMVMVAYPSLLALHALVFVRGAWRKAWYVVPLLAGGVALWVVSLSALYAVAAGHWRFFDPASLYGASVLRKHGEFRDVPLTELVTLQAISVSTNLVAVGKAMTYRGRGFSHWCDRFDIAANHPTMVNVGLTVIVALGVGYLLGQLGDRRAWALLVWIGLSLLPGILSDDPADRRIAPIFPALHVVAGIMLAAIVRVMRQCAGRVMAWLTSAVLTVAVLGIAWTSLTSHFLLATGPTFLDGPIDFVAPLVEESDVIFSNVEMTLMEEILLGNLDHFLRGSATPCYRSVHAKDWLSTALHLRCEYTEHVFQATLRPAEMEALRERYNPQRISFLLQELPYSRRHIALLRELFPGATVREFRGMLEIKLISFTVDRAAVEALRRPEVWEATKVNDTPMLAGVPATPATRPRPEWWSADETVLQGSLLVQSDGWYRLAVQPECAAARLQVDGSAVTQGLQPFLAGAHALEVAVGPACARPLQLVLYQEQGEPLMLEAQQLVSAAVATLSQAKAQRMRTYEGYGTTRLLPSKMRGWPLDFAVDGDGILSVLERNSDGTLWIERVDPETGNVPARWLIPLDPGFFVISVNADAAGTTLAAGERVARFYDPHGQLVEEWRDPSIWTTDMPLWNDDVLAVRRDRPAIDRLDRHTGRLLGRWDEFVGGSGKFERPAVVSVNATGGMVVIQDDGQALLFENPGPRWAPQFVRQFQMEFSELPARPKGVAFDGDWLLVPDPSATGVLTYGLDGERLVAREPSHDLNRQGLAEALRIRAFGDRLYVLDTTGRIFVVSR